MEENKLVLAIDFDGTIVDHEYPKIGKLKKDAVKYINKLSEEGHTIIIWSTRATFRVQEVMKFLNENSIRYNYINKNSSYFIDLLRKVDGPKYIEPRKIYANIYIDDRNLGGLPEWKEIYKLVQEHAKTFERY